MSGYSDGTNTYTYKYDANGIRTQKNDKQYIIDINNNVVAETDSTGAITDEILWGHQPLARKTNGSWYYYIYNAHGDVVGLVNDAGTVVNTYEYTPWGEIRSETETIDNPIKYAGEYYDDELDMIYLRARYYDPQIGRFTSHDIEEGEISSPLDMNRYVYCKNNPIKYVDPSGENWIYNAWNWGEDAIWKGIAVGISAVGWQLTADLLWLAASGSGNTFTATAGSYASNLAKNDSGINKKVNNIIWDYGTSQGKTYISTPKISYEIPLSNGDLGAALHWVSIQVNASRQNDGSWYANVTITDTFDFTEFKNPFKQGSVVKGLLWLANDIAYFDTEWGLLDPVGVTIKYNKYY